MTLLFFFTSFNLLNNSPESSDTGLKFFDLEQQDICLHEIYRFQFPSVIIGVFRTLVHTYNLETLHSK